MFAEVFCALCLWSLARYAATLTTSALLLHRAKTALADTPPSSLRVPSLMAGEAYTPTELSEIVHEYDRRIDDLETVACGLVGHVAGDAPRDGKPECRRCGDFIEPAPH